MQVRIGHSSFFQIGQIRQPKIALVYDKGAYVLHVLREELGERDFWAGLRQYTLMYFGKSVTTPDFQRAMEHASGKICRTFSQVGCI